LLHLQFGLGLTISDTGLSSAEAGLDVAMPNSPYWGPYGGNLTAAVNNGSLSEARVTDMATRLIAAWYQMGQDVSDPFCK
jgi:beta-glucosidase